MNNEILDLANALKKSILTKNTITTTEFKQFIPLFKTDTDKSTEEYSELCSKWNFRVSLYDPITIIDPTDRSVVKVLPPMFNRVDILDETHAGAVINKFEHALQSNHPLRTDVEESLALFKSYIHHSQNKSRLEESAEHFAELSEKAGFVNKENSEDGTVSILDQIEWK